MAARSFHILLVEDNEVDREVVGRHLMDDHIFDTAIRVREAAQALEDQHYDCVLLDLGLPDSRGIETLIRVQESGADIPIVILTGLESERVGYEAMRRGAQDFLGKDTLTQHELLRTIRHAVDRHELEKQIRQAQKLEALGRMAGGVAHDFNNLLMVIETAAGMLKETLAHEAEAQKDLALIHDAVDRGADLTKGLLAFSRQRPMTPRVVDPNQEINTVEKMLSRVLGEHIELTFRTADDLWSTRLDPGALHQILTNLAINARDAMPEGGRLTIRTENRTVTEALEPAVNVEIPPGEYVSISVHDTGHGMSAETMERIFEPFFSLKDPGKGTGLGLATAFGIVRQVGGYIWAYSEVDVGTTMRLLFPRAEESPEVSEAPTDGVARDPGEFVLLVEDDDQVRTVVRRTLERLGYEVHDEPGPTEALHYMGTTSRLPALLITDVIMPKMNGPRLAKRLVRDYPALQVLYMSGYTADAMEEQGLMESGRTLLQKPFSATELSEAIHRVLAPGNGDAG